MVNASIRNQGRKIPKYLGPQVIDLCTPAVCYQRQGKHLTKILQVGDPFVQFENESDLLYTPLKFDTAEALEHGRYAGIGAAVKLAGASSGRKYTVELTIQDTLKVDCQVEYTETKDVAQEGVHVYTNSNNFWLDGNGFGLDRRCYFDNGDYTKHFIVLPDGKRQYMNYQTRTAGNCRRFVLYGLTDSDPAPIKMLQPGGYLATFVWTNHADSQNSARLRTLCYGVSDEQDALFGTKGFVGNGIKATLSTFAYSDSPYSVGLLEDVEFYSLMEDLSTLGYEIIPHRIRSGPEEPREDVETALPTFALFGARNWIDHSLDHQERNCGLHCEGGLPGSDYYIMDLLKTYGYNYTWNYVDVLRQSGINQVPALMKGLPVNSFYKNTNLTFPDGEPIWKWSTWSVRTDNLLPIITTEALENLMDDFGLSIVHCYLPYPLQDYYYDDDGTLRITDEFDALLAYMAQKQNAGDLFVPNCVDWCDYMAQIHNVTIAPGGVSGYLLNNKNVSAIRDFALRIPVGRTPTIEGVTIQSKIHNGWNIFWFDLPPGEITLMFS